MRKVIKWLVLPALLGMVLLAAPSKQAQAGPWGGFFFGWGYHPHWGYPHSVYYPGPFFHHPGHLHYHPGHIHVSPWGSFYHPGHFHYFCD